MSERTLRLRRELDSLFTERLSGDEGLTLTTATRAQHDEVAKLVETMPLEPVLTEVAVLMASTVGDAIQQKGLRPADYWRDGLCDILVRRLVKALGEPPKECVAAFQATLRGRG